MAFNSAQRRYQFGVAGCGLGYVLALFGGNAYFANHPGAAGITAYFAAAVPGVLIAAIFVIIGRYLTDEQDEYLRLLFVRQILIATGIALAAASIWGFLESFGLVAHIDSYWVTVLWFGGLGLGGCVNKLVPPGGRA